jgi:hypothetical protein
MGLVWLSVFLLSTLLVGTGVGFGGVGGIRTAIGGGLGVTRSGCVEVVGRGGATWGGVGSSVGGVLPMSIARKVWIASILSGGVSWMPAMALVRRTVACRILLVAVMVGIGIVWWQKQKVLVVRLPPVSAMTTRMHR